MYDLSSYITYLHNSSNGVKVYCPHVKKLYGTRLLVLAQQHLLEEMHNIIDNLSQRKQYTWGLNLLRMGHGIVMYRR